MATRKKKVRPTYRQHTEPSTNHAIRMALAVGDTFWDYLTEIRLEGNFGVNEFERGKIEGMRVLAAQLQDIVLNDDHEGPDGQA